MYNELGWQDPITVNGEAPDGPACPVPGGSWPAWCRRPDGTPDEVSRDDRSTSGGVYIYPLTATATLGNEGEKSVIPYEHDLY